VIAQGTPGAQRLEKKAPLGRQLGPVGKSLGPFQTRVELKCLAIFQEYLRPSSGIQEPVTFSDPEERMRRCGLAL